MIGGGLQLRAAATGARADARRGLAWVACLAVVPAIVTMAALGMWWLQHREQETGR